MSVSRAALMTDLAQGVKGLGLDLDLSGAALSQLIDYIGILRRWNHAYNLTAVRDPAEMVVRHLLDSLSILPYVQGPRVLDVGTGAGLPGIPLAIARPEWSFVLLDSNQKKTRFLHHVVSTLALPNVQVVSARAEKWQDAQGFNTIVTRALGSLNDMIPRVQHLAVSGGCLLAMKGRQPDDELGQIRESATVHPLRVPGLSAQRCVVCVPLNQEGRQRG